MKKEQQFGRWKKGQERLETTLRNSSSPSKNPTSILIVIVILGESKSSLILFVENVACRVPPSSISHSSSTF